MSDKSAGRGHVALDEIVLEPGPAAEAPEIRVPRSPPREAPPPPKAPEPAPQLTASPPARPPKPSPSAPSAPAAAVFDEAAYLAENPDVRAAIERGDFRSGYAHYLKRGAQEGRRPGVPGDEPRQVVVRHPPAIVEAAAAPIDCNFELLAVSPRGGLYLVGWVDDADDPVDAIRLFGQSWRVALDGPRLARSRRLDVEAALQRGASHPYGFTGFVFADGGLVAGAECRLDLTLASGRSATFRVRVQPLSDTDLRDLAFEHLIRVDHFGNPLVQAIAGLDRSSGRELVRFNSTITAGLIANPYVERFGAKATAPEASLIFCLYGKGEFLFLQAALLSALPGIERYELIFVSNSPELADGLLEEARACARHYDLAITLVLLPGNAGFGAANNVAVSAARAPRIVIINPDVFPRDTTFAQRHLEIVRAAPAAQSRLFGAALYYDDGSLMHGGMYLDLDSTLSVENGRQRLCRLLRVEHYGKGAPASSHAYTGVRAVPAVSGAFMSWDRGWFEALGGFTHDYVFGHYEDADLCLRSLEAGAAPWMQDLSLWHLEGKGSARQAVHEGGSLLNRWLFTATWGEIAAAGLLGPAPTRPLIREGASA